VWLMHVVRNNLFTTKDTKILDNLPAELRELRVLLRKYLSVDDPRNESAPGCVIPAKAGIQANSAQNKPGFRPRPE